ncbi:hypothetical protein [Kitasatospora sp. NPDC059673]|uniref:hypothetical protein n=1 Tax=Kitasatospora sp. NPDC059673 TaxID=3346901 RepID=UPI0036B15A60
MGVQQPVGGIAWIPFAEAVLTDDGLTVPAVQELRAARAKASTRKSPAPVQPEPAQEENAPRELAGDDLVVALREALHLHARWGTRPIWNRLMQTVGTDLSDRSEEELRTVLAAVDQVFHHDDPVLSALIKTDTGEPLSCLQQVLEDLGIGRPSSKAQLKRWCQREADRAFAMYGVPARIMPPALPLDAAIPEVTAFLDAPLFSRRRRPFTRTRAAGTTPHTDRTASDRSRLEELVAEGRALVRAAAGKAARKRLTSEVRTARRYLEGVRQTKLDKRGSQLPRRLRRLIADLEAIIKTERGNQAPSSKPAQSAKKPTTTAPPARTTTSPAAASLQPDRLQDQLTAVARKGGTVGWLLLEGTARNTSDTERRRLLVAVERQAGQADSPLLSALVTAAGGPPPNFRGILEDLGFAVPTSDEVLLRIWQREQERAHSACATPPRAVPARLVPRASATRPVPPITPGAKTWHGATSRCPRGDDPSDESIAKALGTRSPCTR